VALCPELDVASQGETVGEALNNLREAVDASSGEEVCRLLEAQGFDLD
jgi:predicted RNase H-like HicB family nuclease